MDERKRQRNMSRILCAHREMEERFLQFSKIASKQACVSFLELSIGKCITERINRTVQIAKIITSMKQIRIENNTLTACLAKGLNNRMDMPLK